MRTPQIPAHPLFLYALHLASMIGLGALLCWLLVGCSTTPTTPQQRIARASVVAEMAAYTGTTIYLSSNPKERMHFEEAHALIGFMLASTNISAQKLTMILSKLPVKQLQGEQGTLIIGTAVILYDALLRENVNLDVNLWLRPLASAIYSGLDRALAIPEPELWPSPPLSVD